MKPQPALKTARFHLEPLTRSHAAELFSLLSDPELYRFIPQEPPASLEALEARYSRLELRQSSRGDQDWLNWVIRSKESRFCVGRIEVTVLRDGSALLAYEVGTAHWGNGVATEACSAVLESLARDYDVERVVAEVDTRNISSIKLLERLRFARRAVKTGADFFKGTPSDEARYELSL